MNKGGKFVFGKSLIRGNGVLRFPKQAADEYKITDEGRVYLFTGSKSTGGFCVTRKGLLAPSKLSNILNDNPSLSEYTQSPGKFTAYKGRAYCWTYISDNAEIVLTEEMMEFLKLSPGMKLLSVRSSNIAFTMGAKGPLIRSAVKFLLLFLLYSAFLRCCFLQCTENRMPQAYLFFCLY